MVLTNPPLGELNYQVIPFVDPEDGDSPEADLRLLLQKFERMPILPRKNLTAERLKAVRERIEVYRSELAELERQISETENESVIQEWLRLSRDVGTKEEKARRRELQQVEEVKAYEKLCSSARSKRKTIRPKPLSCTP